MKKLLTQSKKKVDKLDKLEKELIEFAKELLKRFQEVTESEYLEFSSYNYPLYYNEDEREWEPYYGVRFHYNELHVSKDMTLEDFDEYDDRDIWQDDWKWDNTDIIHLCRCIIKEVEETYEYMLKKSN